MKRVFMLVLLIAAQQYVHAQTTTIQVFDTLLFFDGYAATVVTPAPPAGIIRHRNDLCARKLTDKELTSIGSSLQMKVTVKAACDNYDRIGNVNMALVPKGSTTYTPANVSRIEIGRYITPFINKNKTPNSASYDYDISNIASLLKESSIVSNYDIWIELELFGVPYAANKEVAGCAGRSDVYYGSLEFTTNARVPAQTNNVLIPIAFKHDLNNYKPTATDTIGKTTKTISFNVNRDLTDAALFIITSNHGSNEGGEEYSRRDHFIYLDNDLLLTYKPGRPSCEPFRILNSQGNGIYEAKPKDDKEWQSFSNWCPGDKIDIHRINLGHVPAGVHNFKINVPDAVFAGREGYIPLSVYLQGKASRIP